MATASRRYPNNLPIALSSFIGRGREIVEIKRLVSTSQPGATRLVTLTGPGGCGKTRLAIWIASELGIEFGDGVWLVELAPLSEPELVSQTVATALGVREQPGHSLVESLADHLSPRQLLLVLDNCEHLAMACAQLAETLLQACPNLRVLATSREPLSIAGETIWSVPSLSTPEFPLRREVAENPPALLQYEAIRLFIERAAAAAPGFTLTDRNAPSVAEVCHRLDGMPLAIELAAARVRALSAEQLARRLATHERFRLLTAGSRTAPPRQQTLEATLDWSYTLLAEPERKALQRLSAFAGGWTLEAAEAVCVGEEVEAGQVLEVLSRLVDKSLVAVDQVDGEPRYRLLEIIRQYAHEKLAESGAASRVRDQQLGYFLQWAEKAEPHLIGPEQLAWLNRFEAEHDNLRAALEWSQSAEGDAEAGLQLAGAAARFWRLRGHLSEGRMRLAAILSHATSQPRTAARARALFWASNLAYLQSDYPATRSLGEASLAIWRGLGQTGRAGVAEALAMLGEAATEEGDYVTAPSLFNEALVIWRELKEARGIGNALMQLGWAALRTGDYEQAAGRLEESLVFSREAGYTTNIALALSGLGEVAVRQGEYGRATRLLEESLAAFREHGDKWGLATSLGSLGWIALRQRDFKRMRAMLSESLAVRLGTGDRGGIAWCLEKLAEAALLEAQTAPLPMRAEGLSRAGRAFGAAAAVRAPMNSVIDPADQPEYERTLATLRAALGEAAFAEAWAAGSALALAQAIEDALSEPEALAGEAPLPAQAAKERFGGLTEREREVAALIAQGKTNREIAGALVVGVKTVETYVTRILNKLGFDSRVQIATWAMAKGLAPPTGGPTGPS